MDEKQSLLKNEKHSVNSTSDDDTENNGQFFPSNQSRNQGSEKPFTRPISWKTVRLFIFPVEIVTFLFLFGVYFQMQLYQQYYFQRIFRTIIINDNVTTMSELNISIDHICLDQSLIENLTSSESFIKGQKRVNEFNMITTIIYLLPSIVASLFAGPLSDRYGRKPAIATIFVGQLIAAVSGILIVYLELNMLYFFIGAFATGISGGFGVMMGMAFSYITDVTPKRWLTIRMGIVEASIFVATATSSAAADKWIQLTNCTFRPQVWVVIVAVVLGLIYTVVIPESLDKKSRVKNMSKSKKGIKSLATGVKLFFWKSYLGISVWKLWIVLIVMILIIIPQTGTTEIIPYFLHNKPLEWHYGVVGTYLAVTSISHLVGLIFLLPILVLIKLPDSVIILIGVCVSCGMYVFAALLTKSWEMFTVGVIIGIEAISAPGLRSIVARSVKKEDLGAAFSIVAIFQLIAVMIATVVFNQVYTPEDTTDESNKKTDPRIIFWVSAGFSALAIFLMLILVFDDCAGRKRKKEKQNDNAFINKSIIDAMNNK